VSHITTLKFGTPYVEYSVYACLVLRAFWASPYGYKTAQVCRIDVNMGIQAFCVAGQVVPDFTKYYSDFIFGKKKVSRSYDF
jgi:hypothetical protein